MSQIIKFGTDGWRGRIAESYTFANLRRCSQGFASYLLSKGYKDQWVVVGYDRRFHSENFAETVAKVLTGNGLRVYLTQAATPTPVISYAVVDKKAIGAVNITASHNPPTDNGFKVRDSNGGAIDPEGLKEIEALIPESQDNAKLMDLGDARTNNRLTVFDPAPAYIDHIQELINLQPIKDEGLTILADTMWGNGAGWFSRTIGGGKTKVFEFHSSRNPLFPEMSRPEPIPPNIDAGLKKSVEMNADIAIITDGDADRIGIGDEHGNFVNQLRVFGLLAFYLLEVRGERGAIVKTLSTTTMLNKLGELYGVPVHETGVGFKFVAPKMLKTDAMIGGEESGGYAFHENVPERDGILAGLYLLDMMVKLGQKPSELLDLLFSKVGPHYYARIDTPFYGNRADRERRILDANPSSLGGLDVTGLDSTDGYKFSLEDGGWLLIRFSGTEPLMRVYTETTHEDRVQRILEDGQRIAGLN